MGANAYLKVMHIYVYNLMYLFYSAASRTSEYAAHEGAAVIMSGLSSSSLLLYKSTTSNYRRTCGGLQRHAEKKPVS